MLKLIQNEWMKLWAVKSPWIMTVLLVLILIVPAIITKNIDSKDTISQDNMTWQEREQENIRINTQNKEDNASEGFDTSWQEEEIAISQYRLDNNIASSYKQTVIGNMNYSVSLMMVITLFTIIVAASIVSSEFSTGTIKMLLTRPISRAKILTSKLITVILYGLLLLALNLGVGYLISVILFEPGNSIHLSYINGQIVEESAWGALAYTQLLSFGDFFMSILFAFMIGTVFRSSSLAIGLTMGISLMGSLVVMFLAKYEIVKYIWITHSDLTQHQYGNYFVEGISFTMPFSLTVLAVYAALFLFFSYFTFMKRDVTA